MSQIYLRRNTPESRTGYLEDEDDLMNIDDDEDRVFIVENNKIADFVPTPWITVEPKYWINVKIETLMNNYDDLLSCLINNKDDA